MRGGVRKGAGRPRKDAAEIRTVASFTVTPEALNLAKRLRMAGVGIGQKYDRHIARVASNPPEDFGRKSCTTVQFHCRVSPGTKSLMKECKGRINFSREMDILIRELDRRLSRVLHE